MVTYGNLMILPGWNSLDSITRIGNTVQVGTLCCWGCLVLFEAIAHFWKKKAALFTVLALLAFGLAVVGEIGNYKYGVRKERLHEDSEKALKRNADDANKKATTAQAELDRLRDEMKWREVTKEQKALLRSKLSPFKGTTLMMIEMTAGGYETEHYAQEIAEAIKSAGWTVGTNAGFHEGQGRYDLTVVVNDKLHPRAATVLLDALKRARFPDVEGEANPNLSKDQIELVVRPKPPMRTAIGP